MARLESVDQLLSTHWTNGKHWPLYSILKQTISNTNSNEQPGGIILKRWPEKVSSAAHKLTKKKNPFDPLKCLSRY